MQERERLPAQPALPDSPKLRAVLEAMRSHITPGERPLAEPFVRQFFDKGGTEVLESGEVNELAALGLAACRFFLDRRGNEPRVQVVDSTVLPVHLQAPCTIVETAMRDRP